MLKLSVWVVVAITLIMTNATAAPRDGKGKPGGGGGNEPIAIFMAFDTDRIEVPAGESVLLSWASSGAKSCIASGAWEGKQSLSGTYRTLALTQPGSFSLTCKYKKTSESRSVAIVIAQAEPEPVPEPLPVSEPAPEPVLDPTPESEPAPDPASPPSVAFNTDKTEINPDEQVTLSWTSENADACVASGSWSGNKSLNGSEIISPSQFSTLILTCSAGAASVTQMVSIAVHNLQLSWQPPTENVDGSQLIDLSGFKIYSVAGANYFLEADIASASSTFTTLAKPTGEYDLVMTAYDGNGNESSYSNVVRKISP